VNSSSTPTRYVTTAPETYWLNPLQQTTEEIFRAGFVIERLIEPQPTPEAQTKDPDDYALLQRAPGFIAMRLIPHP
jgi:hypothetical protein